MRLIVCQTQPTLLAGVFIVRDILPCVLWNFNQLWFDSGLVGLEINVWYCFWKCDKLVLVPLQKFSATTQTLSLRHPDSATTPWVYMSVSQGAFSCISASKWQRHRQVVAGFGRHGGGRLSSVVFFLWDIAFNERMSFLRISFSYMRSLCF